MLLLALLLHTASLLLLLLVLLMYSYIVGECEICKEERDVLEEMRKINECDVEKFGTLDSSEKTIAILGNKWRPQTANRKGIR